VAGSDQDLIATAAVTIEDDVTNRTGAKTWGTRQMGFNQPRVLYSRAYGERKEALKQYEAV
jgi:hypothetical protein